MAGVRGGPAGKDRGWGIEVELGLFALRPYRSAQGALCATRVAQGKWMWVKTFESRTRSLALSLLMRWTLWRATPTCVRKKLFSARPIFSSRMAPFACHFLGQLVVWALRSPSQPSCGRGARDGAVSF